MYTYNLELAILYMTLHLQAYLHFFNVTASHLIYCQLNNID